MNLVEHYILKIYSESDVSDLFKQSFGFNPIEPLYEVDVEFDCYGITKRQKMNFFKSELDEAKKLGHFLA